MLSVLFSLQFFFAGAQQVEADLPPLESRQICCIASLPPAPLPSASPLPPLTKKERINLVFPPEVTKQLRYDKYEDLDRAHKAGELVDIPDDPVMNGFRIRTTGRFPIAEKEKDPQKKKKLMRLSVEAAGLLYAIAERFRGDGDAGLKPFELTSMVRTWEYQKLIMRTNANADVKAAGVPPTHTFGLAFDIGRLTLSADQDRLLAEILDEMESAGILIYFKEGVMQSAYHVIALPSAADFLTAAYKSHELKNKLALATH